VAGLFAAALCVIPTTAPHSGSGGWLHPPTPIPLRTGARVVVLLVTAHPDDEAMFFGPTLTSLAERKQRGDDVEVHLLCLSTGDYDGLGEVRVRELTAACGVLGVASSRVTVIDDRSMRDGPHEAWPPGLVARHIGSAIAATGADVVLSFDDVGVSGHANHVSAGVGVELAVAESGRDVTALCVGRVLRRAFCSLSRFYIASL